MLLNIRILLYDNRSLIHSAPSFHFPLPINASNMNNDIYQLGVLLNIEVYLGGVIPDMCN